MLLCIRLIEPQIPVYSVSLSALFDVNMQMDLPTIGDPDREVVEPFGTPFSLSFPWVMHPLHSRSRSELSYSVAADVAASAAIFCKACRRISLDAL